MELKWLEDFVMLANTASFSRAAEARNVTQSAFSRRIKQLEAWVGASLVSRASLPAELTEEGRTFLPVAQETIRALHNLRDTLHPEQEAREKRITFAALHTLTVTFLPELLEQARGKLPDLLSAIIPDRGGIEANLDTLVSGEVDLFLTYAHPFVPMLLDPTAFEWRRLGTETLVPVAAPELNLAAAPRNHDEGLIEQAIRLRAPLPYLDYGSSSFFGVALQRIFGRSPGMERQVVHQSTISDGLRQCALAGWGVCWLPEALIRRDLEVGRLIRASNQREWTLPIEIRIYRHRETTRAIVDDFWRLINEQRCAGLS